MKFLAQETKHISEVSGASNSPSGKDQRNRRPKGLCRLNNCDTNIHVLIFGLCNYELMWQNGRCKCSCTKDLELRGGGGIIRIISINPKCSPKYPYQGEGGRFGYRREGTVIAEQQLERCQQNVSCHEEC